MKKIVGIIVIVGIAIFFLFKSPTEKKEVRVEIMQTVPNPNPSNATFFFDEGLVTLKDGRSSVPISGGSIAIETTLSDTISYGDINGDGKNDTVALLIQTGGGSGVFVYLASYVSGNVEYKGSNAIFIGDRISPKSIEINQSGLITLKYLDRKDDEPMAAEPSILVEKNFVYKSGSIEEK